MKQMQPAGLGEQSDSALFGPSKSTSTALTIVLPIVGVAVIALVIAGIMVHRRRQRHQANALVESNVMAEMGSFDESTPRTTSNSHFME